MYHSGALLSHLISPGHLPTLAVYQGPHGEGHISSNTSELSHMLQNSTLRSLVQNALSCCTLFKTTTFHSISLSSALILSFYLNLCFEAVALRQVFLPKTCKLSLRSNLLICPILLICLTHPFVLDLTAAVTSDI